MSMEFIVHSYFLGREPWLEYFRYRYSWMMALQGNSTSGRSQPVGRYGGSLTERQGGDNFGVTAQG